MVTREIRNQAFDSADAKKQYFYANPESGIRQFEMAKKYDLHKDESYKKFALTVGDIILGFYRIEDTVPLLQQELGVSPRTAALLGADVLDFLAPLSDPSWVPPEPAKEPEQLLTTPTVATPVFVIPTPTQTATPAVTTPQPTITIPLQSSEPAFGFEPVHTSTQDTSRIPLSAVPSYAHPTPHQPPAPISLEQPPRWGA